MEGWVDSLSIPTKINDLGWHWTAETHSLVIASKNWTLNTTAAARKKSDGGVTGQSTTSTPRKFDAVSRRNSTAPGSNSCGRLYSICCHWLCRPTIEGCTVMGITGIPQYPRVSRGNGVEHGSNTWVWTMELAVTVLPRNWASAIALTIYTSWPPVSDQHSITAVIHFECSLTSECSRSSRTVELYYTMWFLQRVSIASYAKRCISHRKSVWPSVCLTVRHTLV